MSIDFVIPQAYFETSSDGYRLTRSSPRFAETGVIELLAAFGPFPADWSHGIIGVLPIDSRTVAIIQFGFNPLRGRILRVARSLYDRLPHPFRIVDQFPINFDSATLDDLEWPASDGPKPRRVEDLQSLLRDGNGPLLLGATQGVVDTEFITLVASEPNERFLRDLWELLPDSTRKSTWFASYCFATEPTFHLSFVPKLPEPLGRYMDEERVLDYPESRYERSLQLAIEMGDQREVDHLLARRSSSETIRLMVLIFIFLAVVSVISKLI